MGIMKSLSRLKLKKLQPGKIIKAVVHAAAVVGVPGAKTADALATRIGKRVDQVSNVVNKAKGLIKQTAKEAGISELAAADRLADTALTGAGAAIQAQRLENATGFSPGMLGLGLLALVAIVVLHKGGK